LSSLPAHNVGRKTLTHPGSTDRGQASAKFPIDDWIALVYNRCRSRAALATISLVK